MVAVVVDSAIVRTVLASLGLPRRRAPVAQVRADVDAGRLVLAANPR
jgi:hypothetical protein